VILTERLPLRGQVACSRARQPGWLGCAADALRPCLCDVWPYAPGLSAPAGPATSAPLPAGSQAACQAQGWGTGGKTSGSEMTTAPLYLVRAGQHSCYDRVVFDINGPAPAGYTVKYVPQVISDPAGKPVPVTGGAVLQVVVRAPIWGTDTQGHQPWRKPPALWADLVSPAQLAGWTALRGVKFAGSSRTDHDRRRGPYPPALPRAGNS
jgi:hypothetical protein